MTEEERKAKKKEYAKKWRDAHPDYHRKYFEEHREEYREYKRKYYRKYKQENREKIKDYQRKYAAEHRDEINEKRRARDRSKPDYPERANAYLSDQAYRKQGRNTIAEFFEEETAQDIAQRYFKNWGE